MANKACRSHISSFISWIVSFLAMSEDIGLEEYIGGQMQHQCGNIIIQPWADAKEKDGFINCIEE